MKNFNQRHVPFMMECLRLARMGEGYVSPNPMVGALLVKRGRIVARGVHRKFGGPHAEVECLRRYKGSLSGATLYVNLEPCSYYGKTPPCTDLLIRSGIREVVVAMKDPNPLVAGKGIRKLRSAGVRVVEGILELEARHLNRKFTKHITTGLPYVHLKIAQTLDGKIGVSRGKPRWISSEAARRLVHEWRNGYDVLLVGVGTIRADNPLLTVRMAKGRDPDIVILDGKFSISLNARIAKQNANRRVFVCADAESVKRHGAKVKKLARRGVEVLSFGSTKGIIRLKPLLKELSRRRIGSIMVEGGRDVFTQFLREGIVDQLSVFISPTFMGEGVPTFKPLKHSEVARLARRDQRMVVRTVGKDILLQTYFT